MFTRGPGIGLSLMRIPMGSSDCTATPPTSQGTYSYDDNNGQPDPTLANFSTAHDDAYVIPIIKQAQAVNPAMKLFANNWSPPAWMKAINTMLGTNNGTLRSDMYGPLAQYYVRFLGLQRLRRGKTPPGRRQPSAALVKVVPGPGPRDASIPSCGGRGQSDGKD
jgi:glucosylceramidase